eukprot:scpid31305/ scgid3122/ 
MVRENEYHIADGQAENPFVDGTFPSLKFRLAPLAVQHLASMQANPDDGATPALEKPEEIVEAKHEESHRYNHISVGFSVPVIASNDAELASADTGDRPSTSCDLSPVENEAGDDNATAGGASPIAGNSRATRMLRSWQASSMRLTGYEEDEAFSGQTCNSSFSGLGHWTAEFNKAATATVKKHFDHINDILYKEPEEGMEGDRTEQQDECRLWSTNFPHWQAKGVGIGGDIDEEELRCVSSPRAASSAQGLARVGSTNRRRGSASAKARLEVHGAPVTVHVPKELTEDGGGSIEEIFATDGLVEDFVALDIRDGSTRSLVDLSESNAANSQTITPVNCIRASAFFEVVDLCVLELQRSTVQLMNFMRDKSTRFRVEAAAVSSEACVPNFRGKQRTRKNPRAPLQHISLDDIQISPSVPIGYQPGVMATKPEKSLQHLMTIKSCALQLRTGSSTQLIREETPTVPTRMEQNAVAQRQLTTPLHIHKMSLQASRHPMESATSHGLPTDMAGDLTPVNSTLVGPEESRHPPPAGGQRDLTVFESAAAGPANLPRPQPRPAFGSWTGHDRTAPLQIAPAASASMKPLPASGKKRHLLEPLDRAKTPLTNPMDMDVTREVLRGHKLSLQGVRVGTARDISSALQLTNIPQPLRSYLGDDLQPQHRPVTALPSISVDKPSLKSAQTFPPSTKLPDLKINGTRVNLSAHNTKFFKGRQMAAAESSEHANKSSPRQSHLVSLPSLVASAELGTMDPVPATSVLPATSAMRGSMLPPIEVSSNLTGHELPGTSPPPRRSSAKNRVHFGQVQGREGSFSPKQGRSNNLADNRPSTIHGMRDLSKSGRKVTPQDLQSAIKIRGQSTASTSQFSTQHGTHGHYVLPGAAGASKPDWTRALSPSSLSIQQLNPSVDEDEDGDHVSNMQTSLWVNASAAPVAHSQRGRNRHKKPGTD